MSAEMTSAFFSSLASSKTAIVGAKHYSLVQSLSVPAGGMCMSLHRLRAWHFIIAILALYQLAML